MRYVKFVLICLSLVVGVGAVSASGATSIQDGRVNSWQLGAPAAVYCKFDHPDKKNPDKSVLNRIEILRINSQNNGELVLSVSTAEVDAVGERPQTNTLIAGAQGYNLYRLANGEFYLTTPADKESKVYTFTWKRGAQNC